MYGSRKFCQRGSNFDIFFLVDEGSRAFCWRRANDGPTMNAGLVVL